MVAVQDHRVLQLYTYGVACIPAHPASETLDAVHVPAVHSALVPPVHVNVGQTVSFLIRYEVELSPVPPTSKILILKSVVPSAGVNAGVVNEFDNVLFQVDHPSLEYWTLVLADGVAVSVAVHVILDADEVHELFAKVVHVIDGPAGLLISM